MYLFGFIAFLLGCLVPTIQSSAALDLTVQQSLILYSALLLLGNVPLLIDTWRWLRLKKIGPFVPLVSATLLALGFECAWFLDNPHYELPWSHLSLLFWAGLFASLMQIRLQAYANRHVTTIEHASVNHAETLGEEWRLKLTPYADRAVESLFGFGPLDVEAVRQTHQHGLLALGLAALGGVAFQLLAPANDTISGVTVAVGILAGTAPWIYGIVTRQAMQSGIAAAAGAGCFVGSAPTYVKVQRLERLVFEKLHTLTQEPPVFKEVIASQNIEEVTRLVTELMAEIEHPLAATLLKAHPKPESASATISDIQYIDGYGVKGTREGQSVAVGTRAFMERLHIDTTPYVNRAEELRLTGLRVLFVGAGAEVLGLLVFEQALDEKNTLAVKHLAELGVETLLMTSESSTTAAAVAQKMGARRAFGELNDESKELLLLTLGRERKNISLAIDRNRDIHTPYWSTVLDVRLGLDGDVTLLDSDLNRLATAKQQAQRLFKARKTAFVLTYAVSLLGAGVASSVLNLWLPQTLNPEFGVLASGFLSMGLFLWVGQKARV